MHGKVELAPAVAGPATAPNARSRLNPSYLFWIAGLLVYGGAALSFASGYWQDQISRDLWQHMAALKALIADPFSPTNPFVPSGEPSRHFNAYWVAVAFVARALGWDSWQAVACGGFLSAGALLAGTWTFGRAFYRSPWGPFVLLAAMMLSWSIPISHTGYHSFETLIEGIGYPAALLIGVSFLLWALIIHALARPALALAIVPVAAFMFATHQLGAAIGFVVAGCFALLWPDGSLRSRALVVVALVAGLLISETWPYYSPFEAVFRAGNSTWTGGLPFYSPLLLSVAGIPSVIGLVGLCHPRFARQGRPVLAAFLALSAIFSLGAFGLQVGTRFVMPAVLMLHIGVGALLILLGERWQSFPKRWQLTAFALATIVTLTHLGSTYGYLRFERQVTMRLGSAYDQAASITADIPDNEPVGAYDVIVWPIVATGQRVMSVPWPEPGISNLAVRQQAVERLFDPALSRQQRLRLARQWGVRHLILDRRGPIRRPLPDGLIARLQAQSVGRRDAGPFIRFDLE